MPSNQDIAAVLDKLAGLLHEEGAPPERTSMWRAASQAVRALGRSVAEMVRLGGIDALAALPGVGLGQACLISAIVSSTDERMALPS